MPLKLCNCVKKLCIFNTISNAIESTQQSIIQFKLFLEDLFNKLKTGPQSASDYITAEFLRKLCERRTFSVIMSCEQMKTQ